MFIKKGDIVSFKDVYKIDINDLIARKNYSKYMIVVDIVFSVKNKPACKVMCANGEVNWVSSGKIIKIN